MTLIRPDTIQFTASVSEDEIRDRMALEVLESIGALDGDGKPLAVISIALTGVEMVL
jgi:hypothetical protein